MRYKIIILIVILFYCSTSWAAFEYKEAGARPLAIGGAFCALANDINAIYWNPAGLADLSKMQLTCMYTRLFWMEELPYQLISCSLPLKKWGTGAVSYHQFGPAVYKEQTLIFAHGFSLNEYIKVGYNLKNLNLKIEEYGSQNVFAVDVGILSKIGKKFSIGTFAQNVNSPKIGESPEDLPQSFTCGLYFSILENLANTLDFYKVMGQVLSTRLGTEYELFDNLSLRCGVQTNPSRFALGFGINYKNLWFDYGWLNHPSLDSQHQISITINF